MVLSGAVSPPLPLNFGNNLIDVQVTAEDLVTSSTYSIAVTRAQYDPPQIISQPVSQTVLAGQDATLERCRRRHRAAGLPVAAPGDEHRRRHRYQRTYGVQSFDAGTYHVVVTNGAGSVTSTPALLTIGSLAAITRNPLDLCVVAGQDATFGVAASGTGPLYYQWRFNGTGATANSNTYASYTWTNVQPADAGGYSVVVSNRYNTATSAAAVLTVLTNPGTVFAQWDFNSVPPDADTSTGALTPSIGAGTATPVGGITNGFTAGSTSDPAASDNSAWSTGSYPAQGTARQARRGPLRCQHRRVAGSRHPLGRLRQSPRQQVFPSPIHHQWNGLPRCAHGQLDGPVERI